MPLTHTRTFRVRFGECDAYGHVSNINYVRYMQEAAFEASAAGGYDFARYQTLGQYWLARETQVDYLKPLVYGDTFEVKTWVADFRRVRSRRAYEFRKTGEGELAARATTDWVYIDNATQRPVTVPPDMIAAFWPEGAPPPAEPREPFPPRPPEPAAIFTQRRPVIWRDIDTAWHVNNTVYVQYADDCGMAVLDAYGWPVRRMIAAGFGIFVRRNRIEYVQPAVLGDEVDVSTWVYGRQRATATRYYSMTRASDGARLAQIHAFCVWVNPATGQPVRIPADFWADFTPNAAA